MRLLAPLFALLASPIAAEEVTQEFLEQPGIVWVSADTPAAAKAGEIIPLISYVTFADGNVETGFFTYLPRIIDPSCDYFIDCAHVTNRAANRRGTYSISEGTLLADAPILDEWIFDLREFEQAVQSSDVLWHTETQWDRDGDILVQFRAEGERRYHALPEDEVLTGIAVSFAFELPITETYHCAMSLLADLRAIPEADRTQVQSDFLAMTRHSIRVMEAEVETRIILPDSFENDTSQLSPLLRRSYEHFRALRLAYTFPISLISHDMRENGADLPSVDVLEQIADLFPRAARRAPAIAPILDAYEAALPDIIASARMTNRFYAHIERGVEPNAILCTRLILQ